MTRFGRQADELDSVGKPLVWFVVSLGIVALALYVIGIEEVLRTLARTDRRDAASVLVMAAVTVTSRGIALRILFEVMDTSVSTLRAIALYVASTFLNDVTPSGQAGGAPASGLLIAYTGDARYEIGLAAVLVLNFLANLVMLAFGLAGVGYLAATATAGTGTKAAGPDYGLLAATTAGLVLLITSGVAALWRYRSTATAVLVEGVLRSSRAIARYVPRFDAPDRSAIAGRVERFWNSLDRLGAATPREATALFVLLAVGHAASIGALWVAFRAVGEPVGLALVLTVVPTAVVAAIGPILGGAGGTGARTDHVALAHDVCRGSDDRRCGRALAGGDPLAPDARRRRRHGGTRRVRSYPMKPRSARFPARPRALDRRAEAIASVQQVVPLAVVPRVRFRDRTIRARRSRDSLPVRSRRRSVSRRRSRSRRSADWRRSL